MLDSAGAVSTPACGLLTWLEIHTTASGQLDFVPGGSRLQK